jgi:hypothetical protein
VRLEILIALLCSAVTMLGVVYLGAQLFNGPPPPSQPQAKGIVWGGRTFVDLAEFSRWLRSQGVAYEVWALRHPTRAGIAPLRPVEVPQADRAQPSGAGHRSTWTTVAGIAIVLAAFCLLLGIRRRSWLRRMRGVLTRERLVDTARGIAPPAAAGGRTLLRLAIVAVRATSKLATAAALVLVAVQRVVPAVAAGTRLMLRLATVAGRASSTRARAGGWAAWRRRETLAWSIAALLLATISALAVTAWA